MYISGKVLSQHAQGGPSLGLILNIASNKIKPNKNLSQKSLIGHNAELPPIQCCYILTLCTAANKNITYTISPFAFI
jgi:hypothetical protein